MNQSLYFSQRIGREAMLPFKTMLKERSLDKETLGITLPLIENMLLVDGLKHYLLSISQLCDNVLK